MKLTRTYLAADADALYGTMPATSAGQSITCPEGSTAYTLQSGDTLYSVAQRNGITLNELLMYNPSVNPYYYRAGTQICLPVTTAGAEDDDTAMDDNTVEGGIDVEGPTGVGPGPLPLPTPALPAEGDDTTGSDMGPLPLPTPSLPSNGNGMTNGGTTNGGATGCGEVPIPSCPNGVYYTVLSGDTLRSITAKFNVTLSALMAANPGVTNNRLLVGQLLCIPRANQEQVCRTRVRVPAGAVFSDFLTRYDISYAALARYNPNVDLTNLVQGTILCIPAAGSRGLCAQNGTGYAITAGETLESIALANGLTIGDLLFANPNFTPTDFCEGRLICLPQL